MEPMPRASTAPQLRHPKSFAEQLAEMASYSKHKKRAEIRGAGRSKSSPAAIDARDFDAGNVLKNTAVVLALQEELSLVLSGACHEGPLNLFWRQGATEDEGAELKRLRLSFGAILFFAAIRAPLPLESELPFKYFAATATMGVKEDKPPVAEARAADLASQGKNAPEKAGSGSRSGSKSTGRAALPAISQSTSSRPPPKHSFEETVMPARKPLFMASLPDGMLAAGCSPIFHTMSTQAFSRTSPLVSNAFHIGVPQAMLEGPKLRDAMVERCGRGDSRWSIGSLVVLMSAAAVEEWQLDNQRWTTLNGWIRQEHNNFFATACCFRLLLGLEMANLYHSLRPSDKGARLCDILPFLRTVDSEVRNLDVVLDMSAAHGMRPLLRAPWVNVEAAGSLDFNPLFVEWGKEFSPGGLLKKSGVPLMDFASWVGHLRPGRIVYSTPLSAQCGDIYLRLKRAVVIIAFESSLGEIPLTGPDVYRKYRQAVGEVSWWGPKVKKVYYILLCSHLAPELLDLAADHDGCAEFEEATTVPGCRMGGRGPLHLMSKGSLRSVAPIVSQRSRELEDDGSGIFEDGAEEPDRSVSSIAKKRCLSDNDVKDGRVLLNSELFVCTSHWLDQLLGPLRNTVTAHRRIWESEITLEASGALQYQEDHARAEINRQRWYPSAAGKSAAARRPLAAKTQQLMLNFEALKATMEYVFTQTQSLQKLIADIRDNDSDDNSALGSAVSSRAPSPVPQVLPRLTGASCNDSTGPQPSAVSAAGYPSFTIVSSTSQKNLTGAPADEEHTEAIEDENEPEEEEGDSERELSNSTKLGSRWEHHRKTAKQLLHRYRRQSSRRGASRENQDEADCVLDEEGQEEDTFDGVGWMGNGVRLGRGCVRFQKRQFSPPRTGLSQKWRPPTPHPLQSPEVSQRSSRRLLEEAWFCSFVVWFCFLFFFKDIYLDVGFAVV
ncbi:unnamed protein product [Polarella glacialis]|uniref:Uncharacterized protein n=1 Tax=Polarella glacialis TaxID=89957 RepID=A0A813F933_POLGL|nr:unnamed protein product [Polarella glacialis]